MEPITKGKISLVGGIQPPSRVRFKNSTGSRVRPRVVVILNSWRPASSAGSVSMEMRLNMIRSRSVGPILLRRPPRFAGSPFWLLKKSVRCSLVFGTGWMASFGQTTEHMEQPIQALAMFFLWRIPTNVRYSLPRFFLRTSSFGILCRL